MQNSKKLFALDETFCEPATYRLVVELQASVCKCNVDGKYHYYDRPSLAKRVELVLNQPSIEEVHHRIVYDVERI